jgi:uncharacterized protein with HEPN domain
MWRDDGYLLDMLISAREAAELSSGLTIEALEESVLHQNAILHVLQKIGEAATKVSQQFKDEHPEIEWVDIIGLRHRLVHDYRNINLTKVWESVQLGVPRLIEQLERLVLPEEPPR